jgi:hypothetical protein
MVSLLFFGCNFARGNPLDGLRHFVRGFRGRDTSLGQGRN